MSPFEEIRMGQFGTFDSAYVDRTYVMGWALALAVLGLVSLRITRRRMHLE
jgi:hypothetical protein